jgi:L-threonylcarbamoyladenylate synthase
MKYLLSNLSEATIKDLGKQLKNGSIAVIPTDTQYGIVTSATNQQSVEKIYQLRKRSTDKPLIVLIQTIQDIKNLGISIDPNQESILKKLWPNPVSIIIPTPNENLRYLHRGKNSIAFRLPKTDWLQKLLSISGPLVAPSANFEGEKPAATIEEAEMYFGDQIDFYLDDGDKTGRSSTIIKLLPANFELIREGDFKITSL